MPRINALRISKREWYALGGFKNSRLWRRQVGGAWIYYMNTA